jgi:catechol 2,3-dioxygenase-like lactoylglutathione lyase family enzyme
MAVKHLDHYTINVSDLEASVAFYAEIVGLTDGPRPPFSFPGAWLYCGEAPVVHLIGGRPPAHGTGPIDHVAFRADGLAEQIALLRRRGIRFREQDVAKASLRQVFFEDPDGVTIELNFILESGE